MWFKSFGWHNFCNTDEDDDADNSDEDFMIETFVFNSFVFTLPLLLLLWVLFHYYDCDYVKRTLIFLLLNIDKCASEWLGKCEPATIYSPQSYSFFSVPGKKVNSRLKLDVPKSLPCFSSNLAKKLEIFLKSNSYIPQFIICL